MAVGRVVGLRVVLQELEACTNKLTVESMSIDAFPFVGDIPNRDGQFVTAGFSGHGTCCLCQIDCFVKLTYSAQGMPRILLSAAHITPMILDALNIKYTPPSLVAPYPPLPKPFQATAERISSLQKVNSAAIFEKNSKVCLESAKKPFCNKIPGRLRS